MAVIAPRGDDKFLLLLREQGYVVVTKTTEGRWAGIMRFMFTVAIVEGMMGDEVEIGRRWCYSTTDDAIAAMNRWMQSGFEGEPSGWHRSTHDGRRREHGEPATEYVQW